MTDNFALLNEPRRPWLDPGSLKQKFLTLASNAHPDRIHNASEPEKAEVTQHYTRLNAAYNCLADPKLRLLHLLELELGAKPKDIQQIPAMLAGLFADVAAACRHADHFLVEKSRVTSPLLQVQWFERAQEWIENLNLLQRTLNDLTAQVTERMQALDAKWISTDADGHREILPKLEELYRLFGYLNRWNKQIQERVVQLSF